jgi:hypothetical protein
VPGKEETMVDILKIITMCDGVVSELGRWRIVPLGTESLQTLRWREVDSNF